MKASKQLQIQDRSGDRNDTTVPVPPGPDNRPVLVLPGSLGDTRPLAVDNRRPLVVDDKELLTPGNC